MSMYREQPKWKYMFVLTDGGTLTLDPRDCQRTINSRTPPPNERPQTVWELRVNGVIRRLWPEEIRSFYMVSVE